MMTNSLLFVVYIQGDFLSGTVFINRPRENSVELDKIGDPLQRQEGELKADG
jgi:hypothetical protein